MLCDDVVDPNKGPYYLRGGFSRLQAEVAISEKFVLGEDFAGVADELSDWNPEIMKLAPLARLPYASCWIEVKDRDRKCERIDVLPGSDIIPDRIGWLLRAEASDLSSWNVHMVWRDQGRCIFNPWMIRFTNGELGAESISPFFPQVANDAALRRTLSDWQGEIGYLIAVLGLLNSKNVAHAEWIDRTRMNTQRHAKRGLPRYSHHVLTVRRRLHKRAEAEAIAGGDSALRQHFVRGHFKIRKTGVFWWSPFSRGDLSLGSVKKTYALAG